MQTPHAGTVILTTDGDTIRLSAWTRRPLKRLRFACDEAINATADDCPGGLITFPPKMWAYKFGKVRISCYSCRVQGRPDALDLLWRDLLRRGYAVKIVSQKWKKRGIVALGVLLLLILGCLAVQ